MDKLPVPIKLKQLDKHTLHDEINKLEQYLLKKNKRFLNVVFLSFKFPHFCELYFRIPEGTTFENNDEFQIKKVALSTQLTEAVKAI